MKLAALLALLTLGMPKEEVLTARPAIIRKTATGVVVPIARPTVTLKEELGPEYEPFRFAQYHVKDGKLASLHFTGYPQDDAVRAARIETIAMAKSRWGAAHGVELQVDYMSAYGAVPVLVWEKDGEEIRLRVPPDPVPKKYRSSFTLTVGRIADRVAPESTHELPAAARAKLLEECGVTDVAPSDLTLEQLDGAPESVELGGRVLRLGARLSTEEFVPDRSMKALLSVTAADGGALPAGLTIERAWARRGAEVWRVPSLERVPTGKSELAVKANGGPHWAGDKATVIVRISAPGATPALLGARVKIVNSLR